MIRKLTLRFCVLTLLAVTSSTVNACCLLPFLNPFAWTCGHGCGSGFGYGYRGAGYGISSPWCAPACGGGYYGAHRGYHGWSRSGYTPAYPVLTQSTGCDCTSGPAIPSSDVTNTGFPNAGMATQTSALGFPTLLTPSATAFQPQFPVYSAPAPRTAMSTAPIYGPAWQVPSPTPHVSGDIRGDHQLPVIPNGFSPSTPAVVHPAAYHPVRRSAYRSYDPRSVLARPWSMR
ncbi:MAG: hypothetical protein MK110_05045 [Fuerstiella sp.]|nr:hypothetical protein [Fuerstiella sp.]